MRIKTRKGRLGKGGRKPLWRLARLSVVDKEARKFLGDDQIEHVLQQLDDLTCEVNPRVSKTQSVDQIEDFYELRDKGGILGKINVRVYFAVFDDVKLILALHCYNKREDGATPKWIKIKVRSRLRVAKRLLKDGV